MRHFLDSIDLTTNNWADLLTETARLKKADALHERPAPLVGRVLGLVFEKPSLRTRVSFQAAIASLGGSSVFMSGNEVGLGSRETVPDFARVTSQYVDAIVLRTFRHATVEEFASFSRCPVINGLSDYYHPCQALADLFTMQELFGKIEGRTLVFIGDGNNVARSLAIGCARLGVRFVLASPKEHGLDAPFLEMMAQKLPAARMEFGNDPAAAVRDADVLYTDVWTSMGQEAEHAKRLEAFKAFQVNADLLKLAPSHAKVMHCLPAHRGEEITNEVLESERSVVFQQAGNRLHTQKALLEWLLARNVP
ncbi:MAG TPA: ornithine carbamoyltransferase [Gemmataceae bacterium]|jgi:ornithine carbamoyltransferase|nr:ornithine carbamoyltransferase [Gemmataceae bacterium]